MSKDLKFSDHKDEVATMVDETLKKNFDGKEYEQKEVQTALNAAVDEIVKNLHTNHKEFKWVVNGTAFQKGDSSLHYSSACLWNPNTDGSTTQKYENDGLHAFVTVYGMVA